MNRFYSLFSQIRKSIPRTDFEGVMRHLKAERHARGVSCWQQFVVHLIFKCLKRLMFDFPEQPDTGVLFARAQL